MNVSLGQALCLFAVMASCTWTADGTPDDGKHYSGEEVRVGHWRYVFHSLRRAETVPDLFGEPTQPERGMWFLVATVEVSNLHNESAPIPLIRLIDDRNNKFDPCTKNHGEDEIDFTQRLNPAIRKEATVTFEVPIGSDYDLLVSGGRLSGEEVTIDRTYRRTKPVPPPPEPTAVGKTFRMGTLIYKVVSVQWVPPDKFKKQGPPRPTLAVKVNVMNAGNKPATIPFPPVAISAGSAPDDATVAAPLATESIKAWNDPVRPSANTTLEVMYDVPVGKYLLRFAPGMTKEGQVLVRLFSKY